MKKRIVGPGPTILFFIMSKQFRHMTSEEKQLFDQVLLALIRRSPVAVTARSVTEDALNITIAASAEKASTHPFEVPD